jgi:hypothetical protein
MLSMQASSRERCTSESTRTRQRLQRHASACSIRVKLSNTMEDIHEQTLAHSIPAPKIAALCCVICEVVVVQHGMPLHPLPGLLLLSSHLQDNVYFSCILWIKLLVRLIQLLFHPKKYSGDPQKYSTTITPIGSSGLQKYRVRYNKAYPAILGGYKVFMVFVKSLREHVSVLIEKSLYTRRNKNTSTKPQGKCERCSWWTVYK